MRRPGSGPWTLRLEMEGHELTNRVRANGQLVGYLPSQTWADMWMIAALSVPAELLHPGYNELTLEVGRAIPDCQKSSDAWDELLFRRVRLERAGPTPAPVTTPVGKPVTITVVFDNSAYLPGVETAWGFACVVQQGGRALLFDTGADGPMLLANMATLGLDLQDLDAVVISHNHTDHTGGLDAVLKANPEVTVYVPQAFPSSLKSRIGGQAARVVEVAEPLKIQPGVWSTGQMGSSVVEQALVVNTDSGLAVITGCAHPGIVAIVARAREAGSGEIGLVLGGLHLDGASASTLRSVVAGLGELGVQSIAPCHCTGQNANALLRMAFGERYERCGVGLAIGEGE